MESTKGPNSRRLPSHLFKRCVAASIFILVLAVYLTGTSAWWSGDTLPTAYLPLSVMEHGTFYLDYFPSLYDAEARRTSSLGPTGLPYYIEFRNGHYVSAYPPWPALLAVPIYAAPMLAGVTNSRESILHLAKVSAAIITDFSVLFLFLALCEMVSVPWAAVIAVVYALGTTAFSVSSQAFWQHGPSALFLTLGLLLLVKGLKDQSWLPFAGLSFSVAVLMRYTDAVIALIFAFYILQKHRRVLFQYLSLSALPACILLAYNHWYMGSVMNTGYFRVGSHASLLLWKTPFWQGLSGLLVSPSRGLFVYSPILLMSLVGIYLIWKKGPVSFRYLTIGVFTIILVYSKWYMWYGGYCYGPRLLADIAPFLCFFLYPLGPLLEKRRSLILGFAFLAIISFGMQAIGAYWYDSTWDTHVSVAKDPERLWSWKDSPFIYYGRYPYWDLGQFAQWMGVRQDIHHLFHRSSNNHKRVTEPRAARVFLPR